MRRMLICLAFCATLPAAAQDTDGVFSDYTTMRATLDRLMQSRAVDEALLAFGGADEYDAGQLMSLRAQVAQLYPQDFENSALVRRAVLENGWRQELIAYWTGESYIYAYLLIHEPGDRAVAVHFRFNSDFDAVNAHF